MTELWVVLGIALTGLGVSGYLLRWLLGQPPGDAAMNQIGALVRDAAERFSRRQNSTIGALAALVGGAVFLAYGLRHNAGGDPDLSTLERGVWLTLSLAVGAASAIVVAQVATFVSTRAALRVANAARRGANEALVTDLRAGAIVSLAGGATLVLGLGAVVAAVLVYHGALGEHPERALSVTPQLPLLLVGHPLGAAFAALLGQLSGGTFAKGADVGADIGAREMGLDDDDPQNPATIADLAGDCAGDCASRATLSFGSAAVLDVGAMLALQTVFANDTGFSSALALSLLPVLGRAFSVLGAAFGAFVVRTDDREGPVAPFARGQLVATSLHAVGTAGAFWWLVPGRATTLLVAGAVGVALAASLSVLAHYQTLSRFRPVRELAEASRAGPPLTLGSGFSVGLGAAVIPLALVAVALIAAHVAGSAWGGPAGDSLALAGLAIGVAGSGAFSLTLEAAASVADAASGVVAMTVGRDRKDVRGRLLVLDTMGTTFKTGGRLTTAALGLIVAPLYIGAIARLKTFGPATVTDFTTPAPFVAAITGVALVSMLFARSLGDVGRAARRVLEEVRRQLRDRPSPDPAARGLHRAGGTPPDYAPCIETTSRFALRQMVLPGLLAVGLPTLLSLVLRLLQSGDKGDVAVGSVASLIVAATVAAVLGALLSASAAGTWGNAKKYIVTGAHGGPLLVDETGARAENPTFYAAVVADTVGDPIKDAAVPAVLVFIHMLPVLALVLLPLFFW